jgi:hypothetical protein
LTVRPRGDCGVCYEVAGWSRAVPDATGRSAGIRRRTTPGIHGTIGGADGEA